MVYFVSYRRGVVYRGIYLPSLSGKLQDERLEIAYQKYAHRQRQKSLMLVNSADLCLKVMVLLKVLCYLDANEQDDVKSRFSAEDDTYYNSNYFNGTGVYDSFGGSDKFGDIMIKGKNSREREKKS